MLDMLIDPLGTGSDHGGRMVPETDATLAVLVRHTLIELARHSPGYAKYFADRSGARLAYHVSAGQVAQLTAEGRTAMQEVYVGMQTALTLEPGLDTNAFRARLALEHH